MGNQLAAPARVQPGELLASDVPSLVYKDSLGGAREKPPHSSSFFLSAWGNVRCDESVGCVGRENLAVTVQIWAPHPRVAP